MKENSEKIKTIVAFKNHKARTATGLRLVDYFTTNVS